MTWSGSTSLTWTGGWQRSNVTSNRIRRTKLQETSRKSSRVRVLRRGRRYNGDGRVACGLLSVPPSIPLFFSRRHARARAHSPTLLHRLQDDDADSSNCTYSPVLRLSLGDSEERLLISTFTRQNVWLLPHAYRSDTINITRSWIALLLRPIGNNETLWRCNCVCKYYRSLLRLINELVKSSK